MSMRPDFYAAYLHAASQWDGEYAPVAENGVAVYIFMAEGDEYYGSDRARAAYDGLYEAYRAAGWTVDEIDGVLQVQIPDAGWFAGRGVTGNYHGGGNVLFEEPDIFKLDFVSGEVRHRVQFLPFGHWIFISLPLWQRPRVPLGWDQVSPQWTRTLAGPGPAVRKMWFRACEKCRPMPYGRQTFF